MEKPSNCPLKSEDQTDTLKLQSSAALTAGGVVADGAVLVQSWVLGEQELIGPAQLLQPARQIRHFGLLQARLRLEHQADLNHCHVKHPTHTERQKITYTVSHQPLPWIRDGVKTKRTDRGNRKRWKDEDTQRRELILSDEDVQAKTGCRKKKDDWRLLDVLEEEDVFSFYKYICTPFSRLFAATNPPRRHPSVCGRRFRSLELNSTILVCLEKEATIFTWFLSVCCLFDPKWDQNLQNEHCAVLKKTWNYRLRS